MGKLREFNFYMHISIIFEKRIIIKICLVLRKSDIMSQLTKQNKKIPLDDNDDDEMDWKCVLKRKQHR